MLHFKEKCFTLLYKLKPILLASLIVHLQNALRKSSKMSAIIFYFVFKESRQPHSLMTFAKDVK